jgi:hypothetical protein
MHLNMCDLPPYRLDGFRSKTSLFAYSCTDVQIMETISKLPNDRAKQHSYNTRRDNCFADIKYRHACNHIRIIIATHQNIIPE